MTPTLLGRIQTRLFLLVAVGVPWTLTVLPLVPGPTADVAPSLFAALALFGAVGSIVWEPIYHLVQQFRWEKDWPISFGLLTFVPEALVVRALVGAPWSTFLVHAATTWLAMWLVGNGPLRVALLRWRFRGGRVVGSW